MTPITRNVAHRHNEIELNFIETGGFDLLFGNARYTLTAGSLYVFWAAIPHKIVRVRRSSVLYWLTVPFEDFLSCRLSGDLADALLDGRFISDRSQTSGRRDLMNFRAWLRDAKSGSEALRQAMLLEVEARIIRLAATLRGRRSPGPLEDVEGSPSPSVLKAHTMAEYICENYAERISVNEVAESAGLHPNYAMSLFKSVYGISIVGFLTRYRVVQAQRMLLLTDSKIEDIVEASGFRSTSQFYAAFKEHALQTPHRFRKFY